MLKHADIWRAIDRLAQKHGMSASGLARRSGLDPTTFNKSKRITKEGKQRWPSGGFALGLSSRPHNTRYARASGHRDWMFIIVCAAATNRRPPCVIGAPFLSIL